MVSQEVYDGVMAAIKAIKKLEGGEFIVPNSTEHNALTWAVLKVLDDNLFDHSPLSKKDLEHAQKVIEEYRTGKRKQSP